ncbi:hypothetical protein EV715DRAFT_295507 [Schizophyllum commune]
MYHSYGLHTHLFRNFLTPTTNVVMRKWEVGRPMRLVERYKITTLTLVPSVVHQLVTLATSTSPSPTSSSSPSAPSTFSVSPSTPYSSSVARSTYPSTGVGIEVIKRALSGVSALMYGAAHLPADIRDRFLKTCAPHAVFSEGYGLSEASFAPIANLGPSPSPPPPPSPPMTSPASTQTYTGTRPALKTLSAVGPPPDALSGSTATPRGSVGKLMPGLRARIVPGEDDSADSSTGELYLSGPTIAAGYYNNPDVTDDTFVDENGEKWLRTGDRFYVDRDGWFFFSDRAKDTLKVSGAQVSPREIEEVVLAWRGEGLEPDIVAGGGQNDPSRPGAGLPDVSNALPDVGSRSGAPPGAGLPDASRTSSASPSSESAVSKNNSPRVRDAPSHICVLDTSSGLRVLDVAVAGVRGHGRTSDERVPRAWVVLGGVGGGGKEGGGGNGKEGGEEGGEEDRAAVVAALDTHRIIAALHTWTRARLSRHKWLRGGIEVVGEIPKNPTGKVLRRVLVERYERGLEGRYERGVEEHTGQERGSKIGKLLKAKL